MSLSHVIFREGQILHAADLNAGSTYLRSLRRRHDSGPHSWGIVSGLLLETEPGGFVVNPGFAWDGYGRSLILPEEIFRPWEVPEANGRAVDLFDHLDSSTIDVWLLYDRLPEGGRCGDRQPTRSQEGARLCYTPTLPLEDRPGFDSRRPWGVKLSDFQFGPHREPPDDLEHLWPVYLGTLLRGDGQHEIDDTRRPYAGLSGQSLVSVSHQPRPEMEGAPASLSPVPRAELVLDGERRPPQPLRFTVRLPDESGEPVERLVVENPGRVILRGDTTLISERPISDRPEASDWIFAEPDLAFTEEDLCNPDAVGCRLEEFRFQDQPVQQMMKMVSQTGAPAGGQQAVLFGLNLLLLEPQLHEQPGFARLKLRPETRELFAAARKPFLGKRPAEHTRSFSIRPPGAVEAGAVPPPFQNPAIGQLLQNEALHKLFENLATGIRVERAETLQLFEKVAMPILAQEVQQADPVQVQLNRLLLEDLYGQALCRRKLRSFTLGFTPLPKAPEDAVPWSAYRTDLPADEATGQPERRQLRFEFNEFGEREHPERSQFVVGYYDGVAAAFHPCLSMDERCTLHLAGNLIVEGDVVRRPPPAGAPGSALGENLSQPSFEEALASQPEAPSTLDIEIQDLAPEAGTDWPYQVRVENTGGETVRMVLVLEAFSIGGGSPSDTRVAGGLAELEAGESAVVPVAHVDNLPGSAGRVSVMITVMAFTQAGQVMYASADASVDVIP